LFINKRKLAFEINIDDDILRNAGFEKISINNKDLVISFVHGSNKRPVLSKFNGLDDLTGTLRNLRNDKLEILKAPITDMEWQ